MIRISPLYVVCVLIVPPLKVNPVILKGRSLASEMKMRGFWRCKPGSGATPRPLAPPVRPPVPAGFPTNRSWVEFCGTFRPLPGCRPCRRSISLMIIVAAAPAPRSVILLVIVSDAVQVAVPAGTVTVSPSFAVATADETSTKETLFASIVAASGFI